jgi:hypothetical protein
MSFLLERGEGSNSFTLRSTGGTEARDRIMVRRRMDMFLDAPFTLVGTEIRSHLSNSEFKLVRVEPVIRDGKRMLKLHFRYDRDVRAKMEANPSSFFIDTAWILVSPEESWAMYQEEVQYVPIGKAPAATVRMMNVEYEGSTAGIPSPKKIEHRMSQKLINGQKEIKSKDGTILRDGDVTSLATFEFDELHFEELPDSEFTLAAFGLPELGKSETPAARASTTVWYFLAAFVALLLAVALKYYASRAGTPRPGEAQG